MPSRLGDLPGIMRTELRELYGDHDAISRPPPSGAGRAVPRRSRGAAKSACWGWRAQEAVARGTCRALPSSRITSPRARLIAAQFTPASPSAIFAKRRRGLIDRYVCRPGRETTGLAVTDRLRNPRAALRPPPPPLRRVLGQRGQTSSPSRPADFVTARSHRPPAPATAVFRCSSWIRTHPLHRTRPWRSSGTARHRRTPFVADSSGRQLVGPGCGLRQDHAHSPASASRWRPVVRHRPSLLDSPRRLVPRGGARSRGPDHRHSCATASEFPSEVAFIRVESLGSPGP